MNKLIGCIAIAWLFFQMPAAGQSISVTGDWNCTVSSNDLQSGPGSDLKQTFTSAANVTYVDVSVFPNIWNWQVLIGMNVIKWHPNLQVWARRSGNGTTWFGTISGGTSFQRVNELAQTFYTGTLNRSDVPIQYEIRNVSALIPAASYSVEIVYTLEER